MKKDRSIIFTDFFTLFDVFDGLDAHIVFDVKTNDTWITRMIDQGKRGINGYAYFYNLIAGPFIIRL